jgi:biopolymer transport protein ExbD
MKVKFNTKPKARIEILPLIDIVFLLLVFFIYAMLSMAVHRGLTVNLPKSSSAVIDKKSVVSVTIKADGSVYVNKQKVAVENLTDMLSKMNGKDIKASLFADKRIAYNTIFSVLDKIRNAGIYEIGLQAQIRSNESVYLSEF